LATRGVPSGDTCKNSGNREALDAWRYASLARRSGSLLRLAPRVLRQAIMCSKGALLVLVVRDLQGFGD